MRKISFRNLLVAFLLVFSAALGFTAGKSEPSGSKDADFSTPLNSPILWYLRGSTADTEEIDLVNEKLNELLAARGFNAGVEVAFINRPDFDARISLMNSSGEKFDLTLVTESWVNKFTGNVRNEFLLALNNYDDEGTTIDLLGEYAPGLYASMNKGVWDAAKVDGNIYAIPNQQIYVKPFGISIREDIMNLLDLKNEIDAIGTWEDLTPVFAKIYAAIKNGSLASVENGANLTYVFSQYDFNKPDAWGYDSVKDHWVVKFNDPSRAVVNWYETAEYRKAVALQRKWYEAGYCPKDHLDPQDAIASYAAGQAVVDLGRLVKPGGNLEQQARMGYSWYEAAVADVFISTGGPAAAMTGINSIISDDPARVKAVMKFLDYVHTDPEVYNLLAKGVEGVHWNWVDREQKLISLVEGSKYRPNVDWAIGNQFNAYYLDPQQVGAWPATMALNKNAPASVLMGFRFNSVDVDSEIAAVSGIVGEYDGLKHGYYADPAAVIKELVSKMNDAGNMDLKAEIMKQLSDWK